MAFCGKCGTEVAAGAAFCPKCGAPQAAGVVVPAAAPVQTSMAENLAAALSYSLGWITGIIFLLIDKRPFVRFHAAQSIVVFGGLHLITIVFTFGGGMMLMGGFGFFGLRAALGSLLWLLGVILWIVLMVKAYQHEKFELPIVAGIAKSIAGS
jgi:uncharacterized membrane protein